ncbi:MAG: Uma2 family endonuclease [Campylobacterota bacterium]|nr:Uma2 family endonuclease [Campylobacterota bacterium]
MGALDYQERYTVEDYNLWDGEWELIDGVAYAMSPSPMVTHQFVSSKIVIELNKKSSTCKKCLVLNEIDYEISDETILKPDVLLICKEIDEKVNKTPEIIFEVLSKSTARRDETVKFEIYQKEGVEYYILVNTTNRVAKVYKLLKDGRFVKQGDFENETFTFNTSTCSLDFDFSTIWRT